MTIEELQQKTNELEDFVNTESKEDEKFFEIDNEILKTALTDQVRLHLKWENILSSVNKLYYESETYMEAAYSLSFNEVLSNSNVDYTTTEAKILAQKDENYITVRLLYNRLMVLKKESESFLKALDTRKWILKNITDLVVEGSDNHII